MTKTAPLSGSAWKAARNRVLAALAGDGDRSVQVRRVELARVDGGDVVEQLALEHGLQLPGSDDSHIQVGDWGVRGRSGSAEPIVGAGQSRWQAEEWASGSELIVELTDQIRLLGVHDQHAARGDHEDDDANRQEQAVAEGHGSTRSVNPTPRMVWMSFGSTASTLRRR